MSDTISSIPSTSSAAALCIAVPMAPDANALTSIKTLETPTTMGTLKPLASDESSRGAVGNACKSTIVCRYFLRGTCRFGAECRFSHDAIGEEFISCSRSRSDDNAYEAPTSSTATTTIRKLSSKLANWAEAPAFIPNSMKLIYTQAEVETRALSVAAAKKISGYCSRTETWAEVVSGTNQHPATYVNLVRHPEPGSVTTLCPYEGPCPYGANCVYTLHMEPCKMCDQYCLHPTDLEQRRRHNKECLQRHEQAMELSFAIARSRDKMCGICMDIVLEKTGNERRFGILPNCNHVFCLTCIRKWRQATDFANKVIRSCPECRIASDFVCPSPFWVETKEQKDKLFNDYRAALGLKDCKYFKKGNGKCPFGNKCFYRHALPSGKVVDVGGPRRVRKVQRENDDFIDFFDVYLWEFVEQRDFNFLESLFNASDYSDLDSDYSDTD